MIYLRKASDELISHCKCAVDAYISVPGQMDCPWCGCGWLFSCSKCRKAFTFAEAVEVDFTLEQLARQDIRSYSGRDTGPSDEKVSDWVGFMKIFLKGAEVGRRYVYFDSYIIPVDAGGVKLKGWYSSHDLSIVPQVEALRDPALIDNLLSNTRYWLDTVLKE